MRTHFSYGGGVPLIIILWPLFPLPLSSSPPPFPKQHRPPKVIIRRTPGASRGVPSVHGGHHNPARPLKTLGCAVRPWRLS
ncbi:hypothetical protein F4775DRAFT_564441 [Biscogniauxia sp. FL1348]|nr:hypothetical protein F4775DRAFT_564441 [Biscogniauxia sp. FL1348]